MKNILFATLLPTQRRFSELLATLKQVYDLQPLAPCHVRRSYHDTFDRRLLAAGFVFEVDAGEPDIARLRSLGRPSTITEAPAGDLQRPVRHWPRGPLRNALLPLAGARTLLPQGAVHLKLTPFNVSDRHGKLLARIEKEQVLAEPVSGRGHTVLAGLRIRPLRGYEKAGRKILACLPGIDAEEPASRDLFFHHLRFLGLAPDAVRRPVPRLRAAMGARDVLCRILQDQLDVMERNRDGVMRDVDMEFLHDFRIAGRRSRSLFAEFHEVLTDGDGASWRDDLGWLSKATCEQRDLDVMELMLDEYQASHPGTAVGLPILRAIIEARRIRAHEQLCTALGSARWSEFVAGWRRFLTACAETAVPPQDNVASKAGPAIRRVLQKFLRDAERLETAAYSEALHDLRKTGKKLRYLLESFRDLYPEPELRRVIRDLRRLQNSLGEIVDAHTQREFVRSCLRDPHGAACGETESRELQRLAQGFVQRGVDAGAVLRGRLRELTGQQNLDRLAKLFRAGP